MTAAQLQAIAREAEQRTRAFERLTDQTRMVGQLAEVDK